MSGFYLSVCLLSLDISVVSVSSALGQGVICGADKLLFKLLSANQGGCVNAVILKPVYKFIFNKGRKLSLFLALISVLMSGCNSTWFYRPDNKVYMAFEDISPNKPFQLLSSSGNTLQALLIPTTTLSKQTLFVYFHENAGNITRQDALAVLDYALALKDDKRWERIFLGGTSLGGNILLNALADYPRESEFDLVFIDSSFMSYEQVAADMVKNKPGGSVAEVVARWIISDEYAPAKKASISLTGSLIVAHCNNDQLIKINRGQYLYENSESPKKMAGTRSLCPCSRF